MRQFLADKVTGNLAGLWLLVPELLRLGAWDLVCGWTMKRPECVEPRLALQLINEAALCITGLRLRRGLNQQIFELVNGLPWVRSRQCQGFPANSGVFHPQSGVSRSLIRSTTIEKEASFV